MTASDAQPEDFFGETVAVSGETIAVSAWGEDGGPGDPVLYAGAAYVFQRETTAGMIYLPLILNGP